jgi:hypothetical protein
VDLSLMPAQDETRRGAILCVGWRRRPIDAIWRHGPRALRRRPSRAGRARGLRRASRLQRKRLWTQQGNTGNGARAHVGVRWTRAAPYATGGARESLPDCEAYIRYRGPSRADRPGRRGVEGGWIRFSAGREADAGLPDR